MLVFEDNKMLKLIVYMLVIVFIKASNDPHGGVPMGPHQGCDDGKTDLNIDYGSSEDHKCKEKQFLLDQQVKPDFFSQEKWKEPRHICLPKPIIYDEVIPLSGSHRPVWPKYGEYHFLPPQRWLHSLEHGSIAMLYHPCTNPAEVDKLRSIVNHCLWRHVISVSDRLTDKYPMALLAWGHALFLNHVDRTKAVEFIKAYAFQKKLPAWNLTKNGDYSYDLVVPSKLVSDVQDSRLCSGVSQEH